MQINGYPYGGGHEALNGGFISTSGRSNVQNLFAIVQGGLDPQLRDVCLHEMIKRRDGVAGYALGGLSGGEAKGGSIVNAESLIYNIIRCVVENVSINGSCNSVGFNLPIESNNAPIAYLLIVSISHFVCETQLMNMLLRSKILYGNRLCRRLSWLILNFCQ